MSVRIKDTSVALAEAGRDRAVAALVARTT